MKRRLRRRYGHAWRNPSWVAEMVKVLRSGGYDASEATVHRLLDAGYGPEEIAYRVRTNQAESQLGVRKVR
jgi:hypothetical protein